MHGPPWEILRSLLPRRFDSPIYRHRRRCSCRCGRRKFRGSCIQWLDWPRGIEKNGNRGNGFRFYREKNVPGIERLTYGDRWGRRETKMCDNMCEVFGNVF